MPWFVVFKYLHIVSMFFAVALAVSGELVLRRVAASYDAGAIRTTAERVKPLANLSTGLFLLGVLFGVIATLTGQFDPFAPWLLLSYAAFVGAMVVGITIVDPWVGRLERAASDGTAPEVLRSVVDEPRARWGSVLLMVLVAVLVFLMVVKPLA